MTIAVRASMPAPSAEDEEETVCLLAEADQHRSDSPTSLASSSNPKPKMASSAETPTAAATTVTTASISLVNDILGDIEGERKTMQDRGKESTKEKAKSGTKKLGADVLPPAAVSSSSSSRVVPSKTSGSLVVDVHLPPDCPAAEDAAVDDEVVLRGKAKPSKHSVNRFQRCYSDSGGPQSSPKRKRKSMPTAGSTATGAKHHEAASLGGGEGHHWQNLDRIETICEVSSSSSCPNPPPPYSAAMTAPRHVDSKEEASSLPLSQEGHASTPAVQVVPGMSSVAAFRDRFRHCSESAAALVHRLPPFRTSNVSGVSAAGGANGTTGATNKHDGKDLASTAAVGKQRSKFEDDPTINAGKNNDATANAPAPYGAAAGDQVVQSAFTDDGDLHLPTSLANPHAKFDFFRDDDERDEKVTDGGSGYFDDEDDEEDDDDDNNGLPSYRQKLLPNRVKRSNGSLASSAGSLDPHPSGGSGSRASSVFRHPSFPVVPAGARSGSGGNDLPPSSYPSVGRLSQSSSTLSMPVCRICQLPGMEPNNNLISPCRCLGSIRYVHNNCLLVKMIVE